jgi:hypothetical protein
MKTCSQCQETKDIDAFYKTKRRKDGLHPACKKCMNAMNTASRNKKPDSYRLGRRDRRANNTALIRQWKVERGCKFCPEREAVCLELHHLDPNTKEKDPACYASISFAAFLREAEKCVVVCANCHRKVHAGLLICEEIT